MQMKTVMQEMLEWVRATLPMDLETPQMIEQKIESMLDKEKEQIGRSYQEGLIDGMTHSPKDYYNTTYNKQ
jgi:hypothetical protein